MENFYQFFAHYGIGAFIIAIITVILKLVLDKFLPQKLGTNYKAFLPFIIAIVLSFIYDLIFNGIGDEFIKHALSSGVVSGSLAVAISTIIKKIKAGKPIVFSYSGITLVIEGILQDYIDDTVLGVAVVAIESIVNEYNGSNEEEIIDEVAKKVKEYKKQEVTDLEERAIAVLAVNAIKNLKK